jgi:site-specific recombinase XerD
MDVPERSYDRILSPNTISNFVARGIFDPSDVDIIREFLQEGGSRWKSKNTAKTFVDILATWRRHLPPFRVATMPDVYDAMERVIEVFSPGTSFFYITKLKQFLLWLVENEYSALPERKLLKIKPSKPEPTRITDTDVVSREDLQHLLDKVIKNARDRALIALMYDGALRVKEIAMMRWRDVVFDDLGLKLSVKSIKGGVVRVRHVRSVLAKPYLAAWRMEYPGDPEGDNFVFVTSVGLNFEYNYLYTRIMHWITQSSIDPKTFHPYLCRHSKITHLVTDGKQETVIKQMAWGNVDTAMMKVYCHLSTDDIDNEIVGDGIVHREIVKKTRALKPIQCPGCYEICQPGARYCYVCGKELTESSVQTLEEKITHARKSEEYKKKLELLDQ